MIRTDFWGPVSNFGIPLAAVMDTQKSPDLYVFLPIDTPPPTLRIPCHPLRLTPQPSSRGAGKAILIYE